MYHPSDYRWRAISGLQWPTIAVIESPAETYEQYHQRKKRDEEHGEPRKVPFGFARVLMEDLDAEGR